MPRAVLLSLAILGGGGWYIYSKGHDAWMDFRTAEDYIGNGVDPVQVTVPKGATLREISDLLFAANVIKTAKAFDREAEANADSKTIQAGKYNLKTQLPAKTALAMLLDPKNIARNRITLKDGVRLSVQVAGTGYQLVASSMGLTGATSHATRLTEVEKALVARHGDGTVTVEFVQTPGQFAEHYSLVGKVAHVSTAGIGLYAATIPAYRHEPKLHVHYQETVLRMKDGLPKMKDMPKEMGGSGEALQE